MQVKYLKNLTLLGRGEGDVRDTGKEKTPCGGLSLGSQSSVSGKGSF